MIPDHLIRRAALAARENDRVGKWRGLEWEDLDGYTQDSYLNSARAALEAVAADIWDEGEDAGYVHGQHDAHRFEPGPDYTETPNPYRASETA